MQRNLEQHQRYLHSLMQDSASPRTVAAVAADVVKPAAVSAALGTPSPQLAAAAGGAPQAGPFLDAFVVAEGNFAAAGGLHFDDGGGGGGGLTAPGDMGAPPVMLDGLAAAGSDGLLCFGEAHHGGAQLLADACGGGLPVAMPGPASGLGAGFHMHGGWFGS